MITENLSTLKIHKLSQEQYNKVVESGDAESNALYLTPVEDDIKKHNSSTTAHEDIRKAVSDNTKRVNNLEEDLNIDKQKIEESKSQFDIKSVEGVNPVINNGANTSFYGMKLYGKTTQGENPSPNNPQPLDSEGKWGNLFTDLNGSRVGGTVNGVTFTVNKDKSISVKGTATALAEWQFEIDKTKLEPNKDYILSGSPSGASDNKFFHCLIETTSYGVTKEYGNGITFNYPTIPKSIYYRINVSNGQTIDVTFYPMISKENISYRPYSGQMEIESEINSRNLLYNTGINEIKNGLTFTVNPDKSVTVNGTPTKTTYFDVALNFKTKSGTRLKGCPSGGSYNEGHDTYALTCWYNAQNMKVDTGYGVDLIDGIAPEIYIRVENGYTMNNVTFYPMIVEEENSDLPYEVGVPKQSHISLVSDGLKGIPVTDASLATYTDKNGQMWCADYVDCERGVLVQRIGKLNLANLLDWTHFDGWKNPYSYFSADALKTGVYVNGYGTVACLMCNRFIVDAPEKLVNYSDINGRIGQANTSVYITLEGVTTETEVKAYFAENETILYYILATPIETPLSADEIASYKALKSNYKVTSVMNNCDAFMEVGYLDQKYEDGVLDVVEKTVENAIGDISVALDELHAYAQSLLGGVS